MQASCKKAPTKTAKQTVALQDQTRSSVLGLVVGKGIVGSFPSMNGGALVESPNKLPNHILDGCCHLAKQAPWQDPIISKNGDEIMRRVVVL